MRADFRSCKERIHHWLAAGPQRGHGRQHRGGPGGFGGGFGGGDDMPRGRKFSSDDLQLLILALLAEEPRHGYEIIKALELKSNGFYTPSPGMVYPALTYLEEIAYATVDLEGSRKRYAISDTGREYLNSQKDHVEMMLAKLKHFAQKMDSVRRAFSGEESDDAEGSYWIHELTQARHAIKRALFSRSGADPTEQLRIAKILEKATAEIEGTSVKKEDH